MEIAEHAFNCEPVLRDCIAMGATRNEEYVMTCRRQARTEITANRARRHCCNTHVHIPCGH